MESPDAAATAAPPSRASTEHALALDDGTEIAYRLWAPTAPGVPAADRVLLLFHRGHEHSGRFQDVVDALGLPDVAIYAWDARGHGKSPGQRGHAPSFGRMVKDVDVFVRGLAARHGFRVEDAVVLAHSVGAVTATAWVHDHAPRIRGLVLVAPALRVKLYVPLAVPGLRLLQRIRGARPTFVKSYVKARMLTHDPAQAERYDADPLIARAIAVNVLLGLHDASTRLVADAGAIRVPTLVLSAGADRVVRLGVQRRFFDRLRSPVKRMRVFDGLYHDLLHERDRGPVLEEARAFVRRMFDDPPSRDPLLDADRGGFTREEHDRLRRPLPWFSPKRPLFAFQRLAMKTVGRASRGIRLGWETGFDSGRTLDYVYENRARGALPFSVGKFLDRRYLDSVGWRGIRARRANLERALATAFDRVREAGRPVRVLDIATGAGRYVLEALARLRDPAATAVLRDRQAANLEVGRALADRLGVPGATFLEADAFDEESIAATSPAPTVGVVSGLYELFPENAPVARSLRGLARALSGGGWLVYTNQPWHPQIEMIARVLRNREGAPWVMRRRTQEEMDDLVRAAGFEKVETDVDEFGIFTVSLARIGPGGAPGEGGVHRG